MKKQLLPISTAQDLILKSQKPLPTEKISLSSALGRVLSKALKAQADRPAFDRSAMDGYAISQRQTDPYHLLDQIPAGHTAPRLLKQGHGLRVYTGSMLPENCLAVVPQELVQTQAKTFTITTWPDSTFIRHQGEDAARGSILLPKNIRLNEPELAILAQEGCTQVDVYQKVQVLHLAMGRELVAPCANPKPGQIRDSNSTLISALLADPGLQLIQQKRIADSPQSALRFLTSKQAQKAQILLVSGGAGPGDHDWGRHLIRQMRFSPLTDSLDLRPGKPLISARKGKQTLFILPGNPVSHWVTWQLCLRPLLRRLAGLNPEPTIIQADLVSSWQHTRDKRDVWWPGHLHFNNGKPCVTPLLLKSSGDASGLCGANCLIHFPQTKQNFPQAETVTTITY
jgi:molybdopterin molybdotransferase